MTLYAKELEFREVARVTRMPTTDFYRVSNYRKGVIEALEMGADVAEFGRKNLVKDGKIIEIPEWKWSNTLKHLKNLALYVRIAIFLIKLLKRL